MDLSQCPRYSTHRKLRRKLTSPLSIRLERANIMREGVAKLEMVIVKSESTVDSLHRI
jgi:hypothetical protein